MPSPPATSRQPALLVKYLKTNLSDLEQWLSEWRIAIKFPKISATFFPKTGRRIPKPRPVQLFRKRIQSAENLAVISDKVLTCSKHIEQARKRQWEWERCNRSWTGEAASSIRNGVLLHKQLIRPMDYACPVWRCAGHSHITKLQVVRSKCLRIATIAPSYIGNRQIPDDFGVLYFSDHIRSLRDSIRCNFTFRVLL